MSFPGGPLGLSWGFFGDRWGCCRAAVGPTGAAVGPLRSTSPLRDSPASHTLSPPNPPQFSPSVPLRPLPSLRVTCVLERCVIYFTLSRRSLRPPIE